MSFFIINRKDKHTMNYEKNYFDYINYVRTLNRERNKKSLYELHHILPKSIGGKNDKNNLILLTYREHYLAHYLLWKIYKNKQMLYAFWLMSNMPKIKFKISSRLYEKLKIEFIRTTISTSSKKIVCLEICGIKIIVSIANVFAGVTQLARVPAFQADCCGFESRHPLHSGVINIRNRETSVSNNRKRGSKAFFFVIKNFSLKYRIEE